VQSGHLGCFVMVMGLAQETGDYPVVGTAIVSPSSALSGTMRSVVSCGLCDPGPSSVGLQVP
jgi:hypothetical protein